MKYNARRTWSELAQEWFASKAECRRAEELILLQHAGYITALEFHRRFTLNDKPKVSIEVDFVYQENGQIIYEDTKGKETRDYRTKRIWAKQLLGIDIRLTS